MFSSKLRNVNYVRLINYRCNKNLATLMHCKTNWLHCAIGSYYWSKNFINQLGRACADSIPTVLLWTVASLFNLHHLACSREYVSNKFPFLNKNKSSKIVMNAWRIFSEIDEPLSFNENMSANIVSYRMMFVICGNCYLRS